MLATISVALALSLMKVPCDSDVVHGGNQTVATMCPVPEVQGPKPEPSWVKAARKSEEAKKASSTTPKKKYKKKPKKKKRKKR